MTFLLVDVLTRINCDIELQNAMKVLLIPKKRVQVHMNTCSHEGILLKQVSTLKPSKCIQYKGHKLLKI